MVKDKDILDKLIALEDKVANIEFLVVQMMGGVGPTPPPSVPTPGAPVAPVNVDLTPVKETLERIETMLPSKADIQNLRSEFQQIVSGKIKKSEEVMNRATLLLEKGLQMTELETTLLEIKDRLEELIIQFSAIESAKSE